MARISILLIIVALISGLVGCAQPPQYNLTISTTAGGEITSPGEGAFSYDERTEVPLVAFPHTGYRFAEWVGDVGTIANTNSASTTIAMNGDYSIIANFVRQYNLTISSTEGGYVITPGEGTHAYDKGEVVNLQATAGKGYRFVSWTGDVSSIADDKSSSTTITMNADYIITADFGDPTTQWATISIDGNPDDWSSLEPALVDPQGDSICGADADIKHIYTAVDDNYAYVMVETYGVPINGNAAIEINFDYKAGQHFSHGSRDDLHTNVLSSAFSAGNDNDLDWTIEPYPIIGYVAARGDVMELAIPLSEIENAAYFNPTFVNIWDHSYQMDYHGCDPSVILH